MLENSYNKKISQIDSINSGDFGYATEGAMVVVTNTLAN